MAKTFEKLEVWKCSVELALQIYQITQDFPEEEIYGLTSQIRRATISISSNIAEGSGLGSIAGFIRHLKIAIGSLNEVESLSIIANKLGYMSETDFKKIQNAIDKQGKLLYGFISYLENKNK